MRHRRIIVSLAGFALLAFAAFLSAAPTGAQALPGDAAKPITVHGDFIWNNNPKEHHKDLVGHLTPAGAGKWEVAWDFTWKKQSQKYAGVITGDIKNGEISGTGNDTKGKRTFSFEGTAANSVWKVQCFETSNGAKTLRGSAEITVDQG